MDFWVILQDMNIIELFNIVFPAGSGELIALTHFLGFWFISAVGGIFLALTKEHSKTLFTSRIKNRLVGIIPMQEGRTVYKQMEKNASTYSWYDNNKTKHTWNIIPGSVRAFSNGVRYVILHPRLNHSVSIDQLVEMVEGRYGKYILSASDTGALIDDLAHSDSALMDDSGKRLLLFAGAVSLILITGFVIVLFFMFMPQPPVRTIQEVAEVVTTTLPKTSGIR